MSQRQNKSYEIDMCSGAILPKLLQFCMPLMFSSILQLLFHAADIVVVGRFAGDNSLAAVGSTASIVNLLVNFFMGLSIGANILAARCYGAREQEALRQTVHTAMLVSLISGVLLAVVGFLGAETIMAWVQSPEEVRGLAAQYLRIYFLGMPAAMVYNFGAALLRAVGDTRRPLYYLTASGLVNVGLNLIFVIIFHMDVAGVALATVIAQCISAGLVVWCMMRESGGVHLDLRALRIYKIRLKQILKVGLPAGLQSTLFAFSNVVIQSSINLFGETVVAGSAAAGNIEGFIYISMNAFYQGAVSFTSQNYGAGRYERLRPILYRALACAVVTGVVMGGATVIFAPQLLSVYSDSAAVIATGVERLQIICLLYFLCGTMEVLVGALRGLGYSVMPMIVSLIGACGLRVLWVATVFQIPAFHKVTTVYWSYPVSWALTIVAHLCCYVWAYKRLKRHVEMKTLRT